MIGLYHIIMVLYKILREKYDKNISMKQLTHSCAGDYIMLKKMKRNTYLPDFYDKIETCTKDVYFVTNEGNRINLKSMMSQIFFQTTFIHTKEAAKGFIYCQNQSDYDVLANYLD